MPDWSAKQMIGDRAKKKLNRIRIYKRVGQIETRLNEVTARRLTDDDIRVLKAKR